MISEEYKFPLSERELKALRLRKNMYYDEIRLHITHILNPSRMVTRARVKQIIEKALRKLNNYCANHCEEILLHKLKEYDIEYVFDKELRVCRLDSDYRVKFHKSVFKEIEKEIMTNEKT